MEGRAPSRPITTQLRPRLPRLCRKTARSLTVERRGQHDPAERVIAAGRLGSVVGERLTGTGATSGEGGRVSVVDTAADPPALRVESRPPEPDRWSGWSIQPELQGFLYAALRLRSRAASPRIPSRPSPISAAEGRGTPRARGDPGKPPRGKAGSPVWTSKVVQEAWYGASISAKDAVKPNPLRDSPGKISST